MKTFESFIKDTQSHITIVEVMHNGTQHKGVCITQGEQERFFLIDGGHNGEEFNEIIRGIDPITLLS